MGEQGDSYLEKFIMKLSGIKPESVAVLSDFDGTISVKDVQVAILDRFARPDWRTAEHALIEKGLKSYHYIPSNYKGWNTSRDEVIGFIDDTARIDPDFPDFVRYCRDMGWHLEVVSDGLELYIDHLLKKAGLNLPFYSNVVELSEEGAVIRHPNYNPQCGKCGSCKRMRVEEARNRGFECVIYLGDGISDECVADQVELLFAKASLEEYCIEQRLDFLHFNCFADVLKILQCLTQ